MGIVLAFDAGASRERSGHAAPRGADAAAEIVIFPGIRYERHAPATDSAASAELTASRRSRQRDRLELAERAD